MLIDKILAFIKSFLDTESTEEDAVKFSCDLEDLLGESYSYINENEDMFMADRFMDNLPEICANYERGADIKAFKQKIREEYETLLGYWVP